MPVVLRATSLSTSDVAGCAASTDRNSMLFSANTFHWETAYTLLSAARGRPRSAAPHRDGIRSRTSVNLCEEVAAQALLSRL